QGGTAPAHAFASYMKTAVAGRPVEQFETEVTLPEWQIEPDEEAYGTPDNSVYVDEDGNPIPRGEIEPEVVPAPGRDEEEEQAIDQDWLDRMTGRNAPPREQPLPSRQQPQERAPAREQYREPAPRFQESRPYE